ncbi:metal ABC transporter solute-binding protein [Companilactobacillus nodensis]|uniref:ABC-type metal ion transport system, periplasmic component surface adhesin n=1 Tax=Companilactobacillus nodensis DSM 19682 = JCM 14932 = NBRC 107160 TaxID=1423775 RepID=A0A0R1KEL7_9LACO|nr:metal ABC transporter solute-binding protein [Companilactobacillus nodensis]KRK78865.1 ABC-type metal ion transport system, periplasmic component surface adhesin [Companilactobacillus nodensis DSM 19682 = JCM 14932 = NBRC 107160]
MHFKGLKALIATIGIILLGIILTACGNSNKSSANDSKIKIVATTDFYGEVAKAVVGNKGSVESIINKPGVDPHDYEPTTAIAKDVSGADLVIANGLGYDSWMNKLGKRSDSSFIKVGENILNKKTGANPHLWYNPATMPALANRLAKELSKKQPDNKKYFEANTKKYIASLKPVQNELTELTNKAKATTNKNVYVSEPVFDYAINAMGFKVGNKDFEKAVENGTDPSPTVVKNMRQGILEGKIAFLVYNSQSDSKTVDNMIKLAKENNIPILKVTETLPAGKTYKDWMLSQYQQLNKILEKEDK